MSDKSIPQNKPKVQNEVDINEHCRDWPDINTCTCEHVCEKFDEIRRKETGFKESLFDISHSFIHWFMDKNNHSEDKLRKLYKNDFGVYILWYKFGYCPVHEMYSMKALYVGKGNISFRLYDHHIKKDFSDEMLVYFSFINMPNRQSKYYEQLLLDLYEFPCNKSENTGKGELWALYDQCEVD